MVARSMSLTSREHRREPSPETRSNRVLGRLRADEGQSLAEMAIALPILLVLVFGIIEMANAWRVFQVVTNVAREGARVAVLPTTVNEDPVRTRIQEGLEANHLTDPDAAITISCNEAGPTVCSETGQATTVEIAYPYTFRLLGPLTSWVSGGDSDFGTITITSTSVMRKE